MADWKPTRARISAGNAIAEQRIFGNMQNVAAMGGEVDAPTPSVPTAKSGKTVAPNPQQPTRIPQSGYNPKTAVDEDYLTIQSGNAIDVTNKKLHAADTDTLYDYNSPTVYNEKTKSWDYQGYRLSGVDAPDNDKLPIYKQGKTFLQDWANGDQKKYLIPKGQDAYGRQVVNAVSFNEKGNLVKLDSLLPAKGFVGNYYYHKGEPQRVLEPTTPRLAMVQSMYPEANQITIDNAAYRKTTEYIEKKRKFSKKK